jgi:hypothetical protein
VERTEYVDSGTQAWGWAPRHAAARFQTFAVKVRPARARR